MWCPACKGVLRTETHKGIEFHVCSKCHGIWVSGEQFHNLAVMVADESKVESSVKLTFEPRKALRTLPENEALARNCPQCDVAMKEFNYAYDSNIFLDKCPQCKGIWLDPNEIIDIAKHIQYNPELDDVALGLIHNSVSCRDNEGLNYVHGMGIEAALEVLAEFVVGLFSD